MKTKTHKTTLYLCCRPSEYSDDGFSYHIFTHKPSGTAGIAVIGEAEYEWPIPDRQVAVAAAVVALEAERDAITAELVVKRTNIDNKIQSLLAIEHQEELA